MARVVYAKVTDGKEIRKFRIDAESATVETLKKQVLGLFPSLASGSDFQIQYRDADGDVISISSDEEVRTALSHLASNETWLLQVIPVPKRIQRASSRGGVPARTSSRDINPFGANILGRILDDMDPFWTPASSLVDWSDPFGRWDNDSRQVEEEWQRQTEQLRKMQEDHMKQFEEQRKKAEADIQKALQERRSSKGGAVERAKSGDPAKWHVQSFGSWDPQVMESPYGSRTVIGPVGYHMYWGYSDPEEAPQQQGEQKKDEAKPAEATPAEATPAPPSN